MTWDIVLPLRLLHLLSLLNDQPLTAPVSAAAGSIACSARRPSAGRDARSWRTDPSVQAASSLRCPCPGIRAGSTASIRVAVPLELVEHRRVERVASLA